MKKVERMLKENNLSITNARKLVLDFFIKSKKPLSVNDFKKRKVFQEFNESSIYRNISKLEDAGLIQSIPSTGEFQNYELSPTGHHHHHITCTKCKKVQCLNMCGLEKHMNKMASSVEFQLTSHSVELTGLCFRCRN